MAFKSLLPWHRGDPARKNIISLRREMDDLIERFFGDTPSFAWPNGGFAPEVDVTENDAEIRVCAELPGVDEKDIDVSITGDYLTVKGEKREEKEKKEGERRYVERSFGSFERTIALPTEVEADKVSASFKKGVLTVVLPKNVKAQKAKKVPVAA